MNNNGREDHREVKKKVARANRVIQGAKKGAGIAGGFGIGAVVFVKNNGLELIKKTPELAKGAVAIAKRFV